MKRLMLLGSLIFMQNIAIGFDTVLKPQWRGDSLPLRIENPETITNREFYELASMATYNPISKILVGGMLLPRNDDLLRETVDLYTVKFNLIPGPQIGGGSGETAEDTPPISATEYFIMMQRSKPMAERILALENKVRECCK